MTTATPQELGHKGRTWTAEQPLENRPFLTLDAGEMRERLAIDLADGYAAGMWTTSADRAFYRRLHILAARVERPKNEVLQDLVADAQRIAAEAAWEAATETSNR